jgi:cytochrome c oxidase cbb3-type subunit 3
MSSPCLRATSVALLLLAAGACEQEEREYRAQPVAESGPDDVVMSGLHAGPASPSPVRGTEYETNAYHISEGKRLYRWFNCNTCHAAGGGDIGPPLIDDKWIYGSSIENIYATIVQGRPNGMLSFRGKIPEQQVWQLAGYVRSMSGQVTAPAAPGRADHMHARPPEQQMPSEAPKDSGLPPSSQGRP